MFTLTLTTLAVAILITLLIEGRIHLHSCLVCHAKGTKKFLRTWYCDKHERFGQEALLRDIWGKRT